MSPEDREVLLAVYDQNGKMTETFLEWRNKILTYGVSGIGLTLAAVGYLRSDGAARFAWIPGAAGGLIGLAMMLADLRNADILDRAWKAGRSIEANLGYPATLGFYTNFVWREKGSDLTGAGYRPKITFARVIRSLSVLLGALALTFGVIISVRG